MKKLKLFLFSIPFLLAFFAPKLALADVIYPGMDPSNHGGYCNDCDNYYTSDGICGFTNRHIITNRICIVLLLIVPLCLAKCGKKKSEVKNRRVVLAMLSGSLIYIILHMLYDGYFFYTYLWVGLAILLGLIIETVVLKFILKIKWSRAILGVAIMLATRIGVSSLVLGIQSLAGC